MPLRTTRVWKDTIRRKFCEHPSCRAPLWLAKHIRTGNYMVFDGEPVAIAEQMEIETGRVEMLVDLIYDHFHKCKAPAMFRNRIRGGNAHVD